MPTVVLGVTGCIGAYKACEVLRELQRRDVDVHVVMTEHATRFVGAMTFEALSRHPVFIDQFALGADGDIRHISVADAADLLLVAPATANTLGKFARGIADDALSTLFLATTAPVLVAPAMNVNMFRHPAVIENLEMLRARGVGVIEPGTGYLACGWLGEGRLAEVPEIVDAAMAALQRRRSLEGESVVVTAGPTVEDIDPVRFISNRSSGRMGYRLAEVARDRGAKVVLVAGPTALAAPRGVEVVAVRSADEMAKAVLDKAAAAGIVAMAAAVSDYRPAEKAASKVKKQDGGQKLDLVRTPDILKSLGDSKEKRFLIGFAAETERLLESARKKRTEKRVDLMVANDVSRNGAGFASDKNAAVLIDAKGETELPLMSKRELAERIWDRVAELRARP
ncbi:MAG: bifunctional phosphopantothenoylcysteine decarboxylase/phosphopantothenate--cysteine ligase CoaBC [Acidobacteria bacterium]|nr:MAG: bifunctional phosphopantothenoylcysteine decarboxylase/phosphopantothenate--cysteine ligase CoaBC [Acidobacteriota bacterium]